MEEAMMIEKAKLLKRIEELEKKVALLSKKVNELNDWVVTLDIKMDKDLYKTIMDGDNQPLYNEDELEWGDK